MHPAIQKMIENLPTDPRVQHVAQQAVEQQLSLEDIKSALMRNGIPPREDLATEIFGISQWTANPNPNFEEENYPDSEGLSPEDLQELSLSPAQREELHGMLPPEISQYLQNPHIGKLPTIEELTNMYRQEQNNLSRIKKFAQASEEYLFIDPKAIDDEEECPACGSWAKYQGTSLQGNRFFQCKACGEEFKRQPQSHLVDPEEAQLWKGLEEEKFQQLIASKNNLSKVIQADNGVETLRKLDDLIQARNFCSNCSDYLWDEGRNAWKRLYGSGQPFSAEDLLNAAKEKAAHGRNLCDETGTRCLREGTPKWQPKIAAAQTDARITNILKDIDRIESVVDAMGDAYDEEIASVALKLTKQLIQHLQGGEGESEIDESIPQDIEESDPQYVEPTPQVTPRLAAIANRFENLGMIKAADILDRIVMAQNIDPILENLLRDTSDIGKIQNNLTQIMDSLLQQGMSENQAQNVIRTKLNPLITSEVLGEPVARILKVLQGQNTNHAFSLPNVRFVSKQEKTMNKQASKKRVRKFAQHQPIAPQLVAPDRPDNTAILQQLKVKFPYLTFKPDKGA